MANIICTKLTLEDINACFLRLSRTINNNQASLQTQVTNIISSNIETKDKYSDTAIRALINALTSRVTDDERDITNLSAKIANLSTAIASINCYYNPDTNTLTFTNSSGLPTSYELKDTTYTFSFDTETQTLTVHNDLDGEDTSNDFVQQITGATYTFTWNNGTLTIHDNLADSDTVIDLDSRYYTESEIDAFITDINNNHNSLANRVTVIEDKIPSAASSSNQLADKEYVNHSISTATATFRGTVETTTALAALTGDLNDYAFLKVYDETTHSYSYDRYKWVASGGDYGHWLYEYSIENTEFTAPQWEALNSGITCSLVDKITDVYNSKITICQGGTCKGSFTLNQNCNQTITLTDNSTDTKVCYGSVTACCDRDVLVGPYGITAGTCCGVFLNACRPLTFNTCSGILRADRLCFPLATGYASRSLSYVSCNYYGSQCTSMSVCDFMKCFSICHNLYYGEDLHVFYSWANASNNILCLCSGCSIPLSGTSVHILTNNYLCNVLWDDSASGWARFSVVLNSNAGPSHTITAYKGSSTATCATIVVDYEKPYISQNACNATCFGGCTWACACAAIRSGLLSNACFNVYCGTTCKCTVNNAGNLCLGSNAFNSTAFTTCTGTVTSITVCQNGVSCGTVTGSGTFNLCNNLVQHSPVNSSAFRSILFASCGITANVCCCVYYSCGCPFSFNAATGVLCAHTLKGRYGQVTNCYIEPGVNACTNGWPLIKLIYDITAWYNGTTNIAGTVFNGTIRYTRYSGYGTSSLTEINAYFDYGRNGAASPSSGTMCLQYNVLNGAPNIIPLVVSDGTCYYFALCFVGYNNQRYIYNGIGIKSGSASDFLTCVLSTTSSAGDMPTGWTKVYTGTRNYGFTPSGSFNGVAGTVSGQCLCWNNIKFSNLCDSTCIACTASTTTRRIIAAESISGVGYITRIGLGLCRGTTGFAKGVLSVGCNDAGTSFWDYYFSNNGQITNACLVHTCLLSEPSGATRYAQICVDGTCRACSGKTFRLSQYSQDAILNLDSDVNYYTGTAYGALAFSRCAYTCTNCNCFWIRYSGYRCLIICADTPFTVLSNTTTAPDDVTFTSFVANNPVSCTNSTTNTAYPVLLGTANNTCSGTLTNVYKNTNITANPSTGRITSCNARFHNFVTIGACDSGCGNVIGCPDVNAVMINANCGPNMITINRAHCASKGWQLVSGGDCCGTTYCNLGMAIGSGDVNRGIWHCVNGTFQWIQYWDATLEQHACPLYLNCNIQTEGVISRTYVCGGYYKTTPNVYCWAMTCGCTYYICIGTVCHTGTNSGTNIGSLNVYGTNAVDALKWEWTPAFGCGTPWITDNIKVDASHYSSSCTSGLMGFGFVGTGTSWICKTALWAVFKAPNTATYQFRVQRNQVADNSWSTNMVCTETAPTFCCYVCSRPNGKTAFHWMTGTLSTELSNPSYRYLIKCTVTGTVASGCSYATLAINTSTSVGNRPKKILVKVSSSCETCCDSYIYINTTKAGTSCLSNVTACLVSANCDVLVPYRVGTCSDNQIYIDFASCSGATLYATIMTACDYNGGWDGTLTLACFNSALYSCSWPTTITINTSDATNATLMTNIASNMITACCIATTSALKWKKNVLPFTENALGILRNTDVVSFNYKSENDNDLKHVGFIADNTPETLSGKNKDQMRLNDTVGVLIKAVQELDERTLPWYKKLWRKIRKWH